MGKGDRRDILCVLEGLCANPGHLVEVTCFEEKEKMGTQRIGGGEEGVPKGRELRNLAQWRATVEGSVQGSPRLESREIRQEGSTDADEEQYEGFDILRQDETAGKRKDLVSCSC